MYTGKMLSELASLEACELVDGEIVALSPATPEAGWLLGRLSRRLGQFVEDLASDVILIGGVGVYTKRNPDTVRAPDLLFISHKQLAQATPDSFLDVAPELVVEIISPTDYWMDVRKKLREYFNIGVLTALVSNRIHILSSVIAHL